MAYRESAELGSAGEKAVISVLEEAGIECGRNPATTRKKLVEYDLKCLLGSRQFSVEIKSDRMARKSGNLAIEHYNVKSCKPSGIKATKADFWIVVLCNPSEIYLTSVMQLKDFCKTNKPYRDIACGGDDNAALWLYRMENILPAIFFRIDDMGGDELRNLVWWLL